MEDQVAVLRWLDCIFLEWQGKENLVQDVLCCLLQTSLWVSVYQVRDLRWEKGFSKRHLVLLSIRMGSCAAEFSPTHIPSLLNMSFVLRLLFLKDLESCLPFNFRRPLCSPS
ncbi:hypothetical protein AVEN_262942-1 [Araneus ventricosus]|uniref:Uncharacterized protein n=1 Tax=Araneus ventricosus TaxID=182803 RepID=A0A4Y2DID8_ARAVE|nr:hypothetical protein AVEN_262942-1 [Araneus ventricosus]